MTTQLRLLPQPKRRPGRPPTPMIVNFHYLPDNEAGRAETKRTIRRVIDSLAQLDQKRQVEAMGRKVR